jgi:hypothetical protein
VAYLSTAAACLVLPDHFNFLKTNDQRSPVQGAYQGLFRSYLDGPVCSVQPCWVIHRSFLILREHLVDSLHRLSLDLGTVLAGDVKSSNLSLTRKHTRFQAVGGRGLAILGLKCSWPRLCCSIARMKKARAMMIGFRRHVGCSLT